MEKVEVVIKIPKYYLTHPQDYTCLAECVRRGTSLLKVQADMLDKIKAEILDEAEYAYADFERYKEDILHAEPDELPDDDFRYGLERAVEIIDKYKTGSEEEK